MNTVIIRKNKSSKENEFEQAFEKLLSCLPPYKEIDYFLDLVRRHGSFDEKYGRERSLIILGSSIPQELIYAAGAEPYYKIPFLVHDVKIDEVHFKSMAEHTCIGSVITGPMELGPNDVENIYKMCL